MMKVVAVDPGKLSGVVEITIDGDDVSVVGSHELAQIPTCEYVENVLEVSKERVVIVCEAFRITVQTGKKKDVNYSLEILGTLRYLAHKYGADFHLQTPGDAKHFSDNDRLKSVGFWHVGGEGHANDAFRHALLYMIRVARVGLTC